MKRNYNIGLDIGTNSVGWAITDDDYNLLKVRKQNGWGVRLFTEGQTAKKRRVFRATRRRIRRRRQRIDLLRNLMEPMVLEKDSAFFLRMDSSFFREEDKNESVHSRFSLFEDKDYTDIDHYKRFPTIYHVRQYLMNSEEKADPRLIYLALHHIIKYRGNFLYEKQGEFDLSGEINTDISELREQVRQLYGEEILSIDEEEVKETLCSFSMNRKEKEEALCKIWKVESSKKDAIKNLIKLVIGVTCDLSKLFECNLRDENGKSVTLTLEKEEIEENERLIQLGLSDEQMELIYKAKKVYSNVLVQKILNGETALSYGMVKKYEKHNEDLKKLKQLFREYASEKYQEFFRDTGDENINYANYIKSRVASKGQTKKFHKEVTTENLYKKIKEILNPVVPKENPEYTYCCQEMDKENFLLRINVRDNGAIPYQIHLYELKKIIQNQEKYYEVLKREGKHIEQLMTFHIPYYVGPLNHDSKNEFAWAIRKKCGKATPIYPWNFEDRIDCSASAKEFIHQKTNTCTYLPGEKVIPKCSLLYAKYEVLNELNKIRVVLEDGDSNGKILDVVKKQEIYREVFQKHKRVTHKAVLNYMNSHGMFPVRAVNIIGTQKEDAFASGLQAYCDFYQKIGLTPSNQTDKMVEEIIYWLTIFEDRKMVEEKLKKYDKKLTATQMKKICKLSYQGWSRLSEKLLCGLVAENRKQNMERCCIMDVLWSTNDNFMQIINDSMYGFDEIIKAAMEKAYGQKNDKKITYKTTVKKLQGSPAIKKGVWQTIQIIEEIKKVMGGEPNRIFIEMAREDQKKERTTARKKMLEAAYKKLKEEVDEYNEGIVKELKKFDKIDSERLFLYFCQNGKSLYSGAKLNIDCLSEYEIDHIIPQCYKKDDSFDNRALVLKGENQKKGAMLLLSPEVNNAENQKRWKKLMTCGLLSPTKYRNLTRTTINEEQMKGFIHRQLVETRQITKHVAVLLQQLNPDSKVVTIKADLVSSFRKEFSFYKIRELNDYHHAHDAYLVSVLGEYLLKRYPGNSSEFIYSEFASYMRKNRQNIDERKQLLSEKNGYIIAGMKKLQRNSDGEECWNPDVDLGKVRKILDYKLCNITRKAEVTTGAFYNEMLCRKGKATDTLKENLSIEQYGGYDSCKNAYYVPCECSGKKKNTYKLIAVPVKEALHIRTSGELLNYVKKVDDSILAIVGPKIVNGQYMLYENKPVYFISSSEYSNAKQMVMNQEFQKKLYYVLLNEGEMREEESVRNVYANEVMEQIIQKMETDLEVFENLIKKLKTEKAMNAFRNASLEDKRLAIINLLKITSAGSGRGNLSVFGLSKDEGRLNKALKYEKMDIIDYSITGLYKESRTSNEL